MTCHPMIGICAGSGAPSGYDDGRHAEAETRRDEASALYVQAERLWLEADAAPTMTESNRLADVARGVERFADSMALDADELEGGR